MIQETTTLWATLKANCGPFLAIAFGLLAPIQFILLLVGAFIIADTAFGVWAAHKTGKQLTSRKLSKFISKMFVYMGVIVLTYALDTLLLGEFLLHIVSIDMVATKVTALALIFAEVFSIDEKLKMVNTGKGLWYYFKRLIGVAKLIKKETEELKEGNEFGSEGESDVSTK